MKVEKWFVEWERHVEGRRRRSRAAELIDAVLDTPRPQRSHAVTQIGGRGQHVPNGSSTRSAPLRRSAGRRPEPVIGGRLSSASPNPPACPHPLPDVFALPRPQARRPKKARNRVCSSAPAGGSSFGPHALGPRSMSSIGRAASNAWCTSSGSSRSSRPAARARSQVCTKTSMLANRSTACSKVPRPPIISLSYSAWDVSGSSSALCMASRAVDQARIGSSSTVGPTGGSWPTRRKRNPMLSTMWPTTSRAVHSSHGEGLDQRSCGTAATREVNPSDRRRKRAATSLMITS